MKTESVVDVELDRLITSASELVDGQRKVYDAITASKRRVVDATLTARLAQVNLEMALGNEALEKPAADQIADAELALYEAREVLEREELTLAGLRQKLTDKTVDAALADAETKLGFAVGPLAQDAVSDWRQRYDSALSIIKSVLAQAAAFDRTVKTHLVRDALNGNPPLYPGQPLRHDPQFAVLEIVISRLDPAVALSLIPSEMLQRVLTVRGDVDHARGLASGEINRQVRERHDLERKGRIGAPRPARHPYTMGGWPAEKVAQ